MADLTLAQEREAFDAQLEGLLRSHAGQFALVKNGKASGFFPTHEAAYEEALRRFGLDTTFLIAEVAKPDPQPVSVAWEAGVMF